jgi:protein-S-isoprenylcysteine O-methyltransferase Ste14
MPKTAVLVALYGLLLVHGAIYQAFMRRHSSWKERPRYEISAMTRFFRRLLWIIYLVGLADIPFALFVQDIVPTQSVFAVGMVTGVASLGLLAWSLTALGDNFSDCSDGRLPTQYVKHGPYRFISHPIYASNTLLLCACTLVLFNVVLVGVTLVTVIFYVRSARDETRALTAWMQR